MATRPGHGIDYCFWLDRCHPSLSVFTRVKGGGYSHISLRIRHGFNFTGSG